MPETIIPGLGYTAQTWLTGDLVYLRPLQPGDENGPYRIRDERYPTSRAHLRRWITDDLAGQLSVEELTLAIIRRQDDAVIGSIGGDLWDPVAHVDSAVGPLAEAFLAEAVIVLNTWLQQDHGHRGLFIELSADHDEAIRRLTEAGFFEGARYRQMRAIRGRRVDAVLMQHLNPAWVARLGDPREDVLERSGTGEARPVPAHVDAGANPPKNAVMVGKRVYLRPARADDAPLETEAGWREEENIFGDGRWLDSAPIAEHRYRELEKQDPLRHIMLQVCLRETDELIGQVDLWGVNYTDSRAETGSFFFDKAHRGAGYGTEAKHLLLEYAFDVLGLHSLTSWVNYHNRRSAAALRKQGYREAGSLYWLYAQHGRLEHMVTFDLLAEEWRALPRSAEE